MVEESIKDKICEALGKYLERNEFEIKKVIDFEEEKKNDGYCETCWYEYTVVVITYLNKKGKEKTYTYSGFFSDLIRELT